MANDIRIERFTFLCNSRERQLIFAIAHSLGRTQSDALRFLIKIAAQELGFSLDKQAENIQKTHERTHNE